MRTKFEIDRDHCPSESSKLIYAKERVRGKAQQQLEAYLFSNILTTFSTVEDLFAHLEQVFGSPYSKDTKEKKFRDLDMGSSAFNDFYRESASLASHTNNTAE